MQVVNAQMFLLVMSVLISESFLVTPISIFLDKQNNLFVFDQRYIRKLDFNKGTIKTIIGEDTGTTGFLNVGPLDNDCVNNGLSEGCGFTFSPGSFRFPDTYNIHARPRYWMNLRTIIPLPRGDILFDYSNPNARSYTNWDSNLDEDAFSGLWWWYRPVDFDNLDGDWGVYPIRFTDNDGHYLDRWNVRQNCLVKGFTASYNPSGEIKSIYSILSVGCDVEVDNILKSNQNILEFDASSLYGQNPNLHLNTGTGISSPVADSMPWEGLR